jgi:hypothetical protein
MSDLTKHEPTPVKNGHPACWDMVKKDISARDEYGKNKYGTRLQPFNGRNIAVDVFQETMDAVVYARQLVYEIEELFTCARDAAREHGLKISVENIKDVIDVIGLLACKET